MRIEFWGGADTVTGSQHVFEINGSRCLCDCGLFQGRRKEAAEINSRLPFNFSKLNASVLSHAHVDHCGNLPTLVKQGFHQSIHATTATVDLCGIMLRDAAHIQEQDAAYLNQKKNRQGLEPVVPLYTTQDAEAVLGLFKGHMYNEPFEPAPGVSVSFREAGHILGSALPVFTVHEGNRTVRIEYAVDLGRRNLPLIRDPEVAKDIDALVIESTYGDRLHDPAENARADLKAVIEKTVHRGGKIIIPSFALERAQELIYHLGELFGSGQLPTIPVFVDSPMAVAVSNVFHNHKEYLDKEFHELHDRMGSVMHPPWLTYSASVDQSKAITSSDKPCIVIAASGMCEHGRILHHLKHGIENAKNTIVIVGFQAENTLGRKLVEGEKKVKIFGDWYRRRADIKVLNAFSAHADKTELLEYVRAIHPKKIFLVHGETSQRTAFAETLRGENLGEVFLPSRGDKVEI